MEIQLRLILRKTIQRNGLSETIIEGQIFIDGQYICDTLQNELNILPPGKYNIRVEKCKQHDRKMPLVIADKEYQCCHSCKQLEDVFINTPMPVFCPQLAPGNGVFNRHDGSILVGRRGALGLLLKPKDTFDQLYERIRKNMERGGKVTLIIRN